MKELSHLITGFVQRHWELLIGAILVPIVLFWLQRQGEKKRQRIEGRQYYREASKTFRQAEQTTGVQSDGVDSESGDEKNPDELYDEVINFCNDALDLGYREAEVYLLMGRTYRKQERQDKALTAFQMAVKRNKSHIEARYELGIAYEDLQNYKRAISEFQRILRLTPTDNKTRAMQKYAGERLQQITRFLDRGRCFND